MILIIMSFPFWNHISSAVNTASLNEPIIKNLLPFPLIDPTSGVCMIMQRMSCRFVDKLGIAKARGIKLLIWTNSSRGLEVHFSSCCKEIAGDQWRILMYLHVVCCKTVDK
jgi:hypothetical protein